MLENDEFFNFLPCMTLFGKDPLVLGNGEGVRWGLGVMNELLT